MGSLPFGQQSPFDVEDERMINGVNPDLLVISRSTHEDARTVVTPGTVLLRSVPSLTYTFRNEAGETIRSFTCGRADRSIYAVHTRSPRHGRGAPRRAATRGSTATRRTAPSCRTDATR